MRGQVGASENLEGKGTKGLLKLARLEMKLLAELAITRKGRLVADKIGGHVEYRFSLRMIWHLDFGNVNVSLHSPKPTQRSTVAIWGQRKAAQRE